jgi:hypothetical protein
MKGKPSLSTLTFISQYLYSLMLAGCSEFYVFQVLAGKKWKTFTLDTEQESRMKIAFLVSGRLGLCSFGTISLTARLKACLTHLLEKTHFFCDKTCS